MASAWGASTAALAPPFEQRSRAAVLQHTNIHIHGRYPIRLSYRALRLGLVLAHFVPQTLAGADQKSIVTNLPVDENLIANCCTNRCNMRSETLSNGTEDFGGSISSFYEMQPVECEFENTDSSLLLFEQLPCRNVPSLRSTLYCAV